MLWRVFRLSAQGRAREPIFKNEYELLLSTTVKNMLGYSTRYHKSKRLEPHFQIAATRSGWKEITETSVALPHSHRSAPKSRYLPCQILVQRKSPELEQNCGISQRKNWEVEVVPVVDLIAYKSFFPWGTATQVESSASQGQPPSDSIMSTSVASNHRGSCPGGVSAEEQGLSLIHI